MNTSGAISPSNIGTSSNNPTNTYTHGNIQKIGERLSSDISSNGNDISLLNCFTHEGDDKITIDSRQGSILIEKGEIAADVKSTSGKIVVKEAVLKKINTEKGAVDISKRTNVEAIETLGSGDVTVSESVVNENISTTGGIVKLLQGSTAKQINTTLAGGSVIVDQSQVVEDISTYGGSVQIQNKSKVNNITTLISRGEITVDESTVSGLIKTADASVTLTCKANVSNINTKGDLASVTVRESSAKEINTIGGYIEIQTPTYLSESLTTERGLIFINSAESSNNINIDQKTGISFIYKTTLSGTLETNSKCTVINQDSKLEHIHFKIPAESNTNAQFPREPNLAPKTQMI
ncbi:hypothetical protein GTU79_25605 [Sodalis ligni]|uniref:hypothetical protein n=1 Tax=Sodalis ligni TaxID=2697027 RepID=UPI001BDF47B8|nr:hypothetical protein [Sodalis ligni]QWA10536.1 hypothetical protein GTU79_25605 [Sodalis ligni]